MTRGEPTIDLAGVPLRLLPERGVFRPDRSELLVADVHLGKAAAFRRAGRPLPHGTTRRELERLDALLERTGAARLTFLGDLFHDEVEAESSTARTFRAWLEARAHIDITLVRGNHDRHARTLIGALPMRAVPEPHAVDGLAYRHHPVGTAPSLAGHVHPGVRLDDGLDRMKLPVFWRRGDALTLPAFGAFTGLQIIDPVPGEGVHVVTPTGVVEIAGGRVARR